MRCARSRLCTCLLCYAGPDVVRRRSGGCGVSETTWARRKRSFLGKEADRWFRRFVGGSVGSDVSGARTDSRSSFMSHVTWNRPTLCVTLATSDASRPSVASLWYALSTSGARRAKRMTTNVELTTGSLGTYNCSSRALRRRRRRRSSSLASFGSGSESVGVSLSFDSEGVSSEGVASGTVITPPLPFLRLAAGMIEGWPTRWIYPPIGKTKAPFRTPSGLPSASELRSSYDCQQG